ncbi:hypothetical protein [Iningainema tapete]|uniref:Tetratricopeptide repeat protein n=1 Tax=Iningainema tapete BLCC-T55 TaxID=2748662 RepID=A0A8J6XNX1_9CYAN|nr:hypothetical protein [Iningainema tapete]MBD2773917.1 hypothetical protein [Iningainema tapete BLCC-T55]
MIPSITDSAVKAAIAAIKSESATTPEKIEMLIEMALGFQKKPKTTQDLHNAVELYAQAEQLCGEDYLFLKARAKAGMASVLRTIPDVGAEFLQRSLALYSEALPILQQFAKPAEVAEAQMNLGLVLQSLVPFNLARIGDSIKAYQEALKVFTWEKYPQEYAILQNNIAIAYLSMPMTSQQDYLRQGLAVQTFEEALKHIRLIEHPREYAMLQNNLGNALQYLPSAHPVDNILQAIAAYDEALKVRSAHSTPLEYANTISNKANALSGLDWRQACVFYQEAWDIFSRYGEVGQAQVVGEALRELEELNRKDAKDTKE